MSFLWTKWTKTWTINTDDKEKSRWINFVSDFYCFLLPIDFIMLSFHYLCRTMVCEWSLLIDFLYSFLCSKNKEWLSYKQKWWSGKNDGDFFFHPRLKWTSAWNVSEQGISGDNRAWNSTHERDCIEGIRLP